MWNQSCVFNYIEPQINCLLIIEKIDKKKCIPYICSKKTLWTRQVLLSKSYFLWHGIKLIYCLRAVQSFMIKTIYINFHGLMFCENMGFTLLWEMSLPFVSDGNFVVCLLVWISSLLLDILKSSLRCRKKESYKHIITTIQIVQMCTLLLSFRKAWNGTYFAVPSIGLHFHMPLTGYLFNLKDNLMLKMCI